MQVHDGLTMMQQKITGYLPANDGAKAAFKDADIIVIPAGIPRTYYPDYVTLPCLS